MTNGVKKFNESYTVQIVVTGTCTKWIFFFRDQLIKYGKTLMMNYIQGNIIVKYQLPINIGWINCGILVLNEFRHSVIVQNYAVEVGGKFQTPRFSSRPRRQKLFVWRLCSSRDYRFQKRAITSYFAERGPERRPTKRTAYIILSIKHNIFSIWLRVAFYEHFVFPTAAAYRFTILYYARGLAKVRRTL